MGGSQIQSLSNIVTTYPPSRAILRLSLKTRFRMYPCSPPCSCWLCQSLSPVSIDTHSSWSLRIEHKRNVTWRDSKALYVTLHYYRGVKLIFSRGGHISSTAPTWRAGCKRYRLHRCNYYITHSYMFLQLIIVSIIYKYCLCSMY